MGAVCCRNAPSGDIRRISNCLGDIALPCQLWETWAITLLTMSVDGKMSFDFIEDLEGMYSNMQCMRGITYLRLCGVFANKLQISLKYAILKNLLKTTDLRNMEAV